MYGAKHGTTPVAVATNKNIKPRAEKTFKRKPDA